MGRGPGVRAVGAEAIQIDFRWKGQRCRERLRLRPTEANLKYARRLKAAIEHEITTGTFDYARYFPDSTRARREAGTPLLDALLAYVDTLTGSVEPETLNDYRRDAKILARWFHGATLEGLTRARIRAELATRQLSKARLSNILRPLRGAFEQRLEDDPTFKNPLAGFTLRRVESVEGDEIDPFTPEELARLSAAPSGELWTFWAWTGLRTGELIGLRCRDVGPQCRFIEVRRAVRRGREKAPKTRAGRRRCDLLPPARNVLLGLNLEQRDPDDPVFRNPRTGKFWHNAQAVAREFRRACKAANVRYRYPYQLRHTFATWAISSGENPLWVARRMGHRDVTVLFQHYAKWMPGLDKQAGARMLATADQKQNAA